MNDAVAIRVSREARDILSAYAGEQGLSLSALLEEFARRVERIDALRSEREATRVDVERDSGGEEDREWETVLADGFS